MYHPRIVDLEIRELLDSIGAVLIEGPRACGKTETARQLAESEVRLDVDAEARRAIAIDPSLILEGDTPRLIDEWQVEPEIWNHVRRAVDDRQATGQFLLTGSSVPADDRTRHTGAGRVGRVRMRPMSLYETGHSSGAISLSALLSGEAARSPDPGMTLSGLAERITVGGWPGLLDRDPRAAMKVVRGLHGRGSDRLISRGSGGRPTIPIGSGCSSELWLETSPPTRPLRLLHVTRQVARGPRWMRTRRTRTSTPSIG